MGLMDLLPYGFSSCNTPDLSILVFTVRVLVERWELSCVRSAAE